MYIHYTLLKLNLIFVVILQYIYIYMHVHLDIIMHVKTQLHLTAATPLYKFYILINYLS